jgi:hypothetical protein
LEKEKISDKNTPRFWKRGSVTYGDGKVVAASKLSDLAGVAERGTHNNSLVTELLVVVEDALDGNDTRVLLLGVLLLGAGLEPVEDATNEWRDEESTSLGSTNGLNEREHERQVAVDAVVSLENLGSFDALPSRGNLDEDAFLGYALFLVELFEIVVNAWAPGKSWKASEVMLIPR